jgi:aspartate/methionine/tyrosine aminotransferase
MNALSAQENSDASDPEYEQFLDSILGIFTNCAKNVTDPKTFIPRNRPLLWANYLRGKLARLVHAITEGRPRREFSPGEVIDLSGGKSRFSASALTLQKVRHSYDRVRSQFAAVMRPATSAKVIASHLDGELFHYLDLCTSGFGQCQLALTRALGIGSEYVDTCEATFFCKRREQMLGHLRTLVAERYTEALEYRIPAAQLGLVAGSSVYLSTFVLEALMPPGSVLLVPDFSFYGTLNAILSMHRNQRWRPDSVVRAVPGTAANDYKLSPRALAAAIANDPVPTKVVWVTNPTNLGAIYSREELDALADVINRYDLYVIGDEFYAGLGSEECHVSLAALPSLAERLVLLCSSSKLVNFYDGDHILHLEQREPVNMLTEDINVFAGGFSFFFTHNQGLAARIWAQIGYHPFTLRRCIYAAALLEHTPIEEFRANSEGSRADRKRASALLDVLVQDLSGTAEQAPHGGALVWPLVTPRTGQYFALEFDREKCRRFGIRDAAQLAAFLYAEARVKLEVALSLTDHDLLGLRLNFSVPDEQLQRAFRRLEQALQKLLYYSSKRMTVRDFLPPRALALVDETYESELARYRIPCSDPTELARPFESLAL